MFQRSEYEDGWRETESQQPNEKDSSGSSDSLQNIFRRIDDQLVAIESDDRNGYCRDKDGDCLETTGRFATGRGIPERPVVIEQFDKSKRHRHQA